MATRYYARGNQVYVSPTPEEHKLAQKAGFKAVSLWDAIKFDKWYRERGQENKALPPGFSLLNAIGITSNGKAGLFGIYEVTDGRLAYTGQRFVKTGRGTYALIGPEHYATIQAVQNGED